MPSVGRSSALLVPLFAPLLPLTAFLACTGDDPALVSSPPTNGNDGGEGGTNGAFTLAPPPRVVLTAGETVKIPVAIERTNGFAGAVKIVAQPLPEGLAAVPLTLEGSTTTAELVVTATPTAPQANATIQLVATTDGGASTTKDLRVLVRGKNGARDTTFGDANGAVVIPGGYPRHLRRMNDDGILIVNGDLLARVSPDGKRDTTFGTDGKATFKAPVPDDVPMIVRIQKDGKIVVAGRTTDRKTAVVHRFTATGVYDTAFGNQGVTSFPLLNDVQYVFGMDVDAEGRVVLGIPALGPTENATFTRLTATGTVDTTYPVHSTIAKAWGHVILRADGTPIAFGGSGAGPTYYGVGMSIVTGAAIPTTEISNSSWAYPDVRSAFVDAKGRFVVVGTGDNADVPSEGFLMRATATGASDDTFAAPLLKVGNDPAAHVSAHSVFEHAGKLVVVANLAGANDANSAVLARYEENGSSDLTFGKDGVVIEKDALGGFATAAAQQQDLPAIVVGRFQGNDAVLLRYWL